MRLEDAEKNKMEFKSKLSSVWIGGNKLDKQLCEIENITKFYKSQEEVIKIDNDFKMVNKAGYDTKHGKAFKILTTKQML